MTDNVKQREKPMVPAARTLYWRAAHGIKDSAKRKQIRDVIENYYDSYNRNPNEFTAKPIKRLVFFLQLTGARNVLDIKDKFTIADYVELSDDELINDPRYKNLRGEECAACGTHVSRNFYLIEREGAIKDHYHIGYDCMDRMEEQFSIDLGTIRYHAEQDPVKREQRTEDLHKLVSEAAAREADDVNGIDTLAWIVQSMDAHGDDYDPTLGLKLLQERGSYKDWLLTQTVIPEHIERLLSEASRIHVRLPRYKQKQLWHYIAENRLFTGAVYKGILQDVMLLHQEGTCNLSKDHHALINDILDRKEDEQKQPMQVTPKQITDIITAIPFDVRKERKNRNKAVLERYPGFVIAQALDDILPVFHMDKGIWHDAYVRDSYVYATALTDGEYHLIKRVAKRWLCGLSRSPQGYDRTKLYHLATEIEPIQRFSALVPYLLQMQRKIQYARETYFPEAAQKLDAIKNTIQGFPAGKERIRALHDHVDKMAADIDEPRRTLKLNAIPTEDFHQETGLGNLDAIMDCITRSYAETDKTWTKYQKHLGRVKEHAQYKFLTTEAYDDVNPSDVQVIKSLSRRLNTYVNISLLDQHPKERWHNYQHSLRVLQAAAQNPLVLEMRLIKDRKRFATADYVPEQLLVTLSKRTNEQLKTMWIAKAAHESEYVLSALRNRKATAQDVLAAKAKLEAFIAKSNHVFAPEREHDVSVFYQPLKLGTIIQGEALKYIAPDEVYRLKEHSEGMIRISKLAHDDDFRKKLDTVVQEYKPEYMRYYKDGNPATPVVDKNLVGNLFSPERIAQDRDDRPIYAHKQLKENVEKLLGDLPYYRAAHARRTRTATKGRSELKDQYLDRFHDRVKSDAVLCRLINGITAGKKGDFTREQLSRSWVDRLFVTWSRHTGASELRFKDVLTGEEERLSRSYQIEWERQLEQRAPYLVEERNAYMTRKQYENLFQPALQKLLTIADETLLAFSEQYTH